MPTLVYMIWIETIVISIHSLRFGWLEKLKKISVVHLSHAFSFLQPILLSFHNTEILRSGLATHTGPQRKPRSSRVVRLISYSGCGVVFYYAGAYAIYKDSFLPAEAPVTLSVILHFGNFENESCKHDLVQSEAIQKFFLRFLGKILTTRAG